MKKLFSILMAVCMLASICTLSAGAATVSETSVYTGIPNAETKTFKDGNLQLDVVAGENTVVTNVDDGIKIVNKEDASNAVRLKIAYPSDKKSGSLKISFTFKLIGNEDGVADNIVPSNFGMYTYQKDMETELHGSIWYLDSQGKWRAGSNNRAKDDTEYTMNYTIDLSSGEYTTKRASTAVTDGAGTADITGGFGAIVVSLSTPEVAGNGIFFKNISVTEISDKYSDYSYLINGVPTIGEKYNGVTVSTSFASGATGTIENVDNTIVLNANETTLSKKLRLQFEKTYTVLENNKSEYLELLCSASKELTSESRLFFKLTANGTEQGGGNINPTVGVNFVIPNKQHRVGLLIDYKNKVYCIYVDGLKCGQWAIPETFQKAHLEFYDKTGAKFTVHDVKFMQIEPYNYNAATNEYADTSKLLLDKIPLYTIDKWAENVISFESVLNGTATKAKADSVNGIVYSGTDAIKEGSEPGDWVRLIVMPGVTKETVPSGYVRITYDFALAGEDGQRVSIAGRDKAGEGNWIINNGNTLNPGEHKIEFLYNPQTDKYTYYVDGVKSRIIDNSNEGLPEVMLEYQAVAKTDTLTLKNVSVKIMEDVGEDSVGEISISDDSLTASVKIVGGKEFGSELSGSYLVIAAYDDEKITAIDLKFLSIVKGEKEYSVALDSLEGGTYVKAFLRKGMETIATPVQK